MMLGEVFGSEFIKEIFFCVLLECLHMVKYSSTESQKVAVIWIQNVQGSPSIISDKLASDKLGRGRMLM
jgi:hypothetical protein